ncbi:putative ribonuclease H-like domain-containing protein [Tanacetum coccineum]
MSFDDLYNNFKIIEQEVKGTASSSSSSQNVAFVSSSNISTASTQVSTANLCDDTVYAFLASQPNGYQLVHEDLKQIHEDDLEEMDLKWQLALLSMKTRRFFQKTRRSITINGSDTAGYDKSKVECFNYHKVGHFAKECRGTRNQDSRNRNQDSSRRTVNVEETSSKAMLAIDGAGFDWSYMADDEVPTNMALMAFSDSEIHNDKTCSKTCLKSFETLKTQLDDLRIEFNKSEFNLVNYKRGLASVEEQLIFYKKNEVIFCEQLVVLKRDISYKDSEISVLKGELEKLKQEKESNQLKIENFDNASKSLDKLIESQIPDKSRKGLRFPQFEGYGPKTSKNVCEDTSNKVRESPDASMVEKLVLDDKLEKKTVFPIIAKIEFVRAKQQEKPVRKPVKYAEMYSFDHVQANCNYHQRERVVSGNNNTRLNYNYSAKKTHPSTQKNMVPRAVLMKTGLRSLNTARPVNTAHPKTTVYSARPMSNFSKAAQSTVKRPYQTKTALTNKNSSQKVNTAKRKVYTTRPNSAVVNVVRANQVNAVKASACWVWRHTKLNNFKEFDGGYVTFGGGAKGGKITGKGILKTGKLDFEDVYFVKELQFKLFSVTQMCDKKNSVLFTDTVCFVLSPDFKLPDESQVLLKVPRKKNMYSVDMKNIIPKESLTCLVAKATLDESMLWHRRLGHVNFKTINKLVKENLVRGLPTKRFENNQTCVACLKGKQHKASCKSKIHNSITQPLFMLHMDLFGPTFVSSLMNNKYCLILTDDYSRFTWVFFLASKDETSGILKRFITEIRNLVDKKVKIIRCDNGTEFKNRVMSEFYEKKGIKKEFSASRTPQQNGVADRRKNTLIETARTMLADSKLPTIFFAKAVNTACYVQNRVLVVKPHNKTLYELFRGRTPTLSFMRPFGCHVTILNTLDYLGKFDGKSDEGFFVEYSLNSMAFRVYNIRTRKVEENLHIRFLEDKPIIAGDGPKWLYRESCTGHSSKETGSSQDYILMPLWKDGSLFDSSSKNASNDEPQPSSDAGKKDDEGVSQESGIDDQERPKNSTQDVNTVGPSINTASTNSGVQTRRMTKTSNEQGFISAVYEGKTHEDLHTCLFACFLSQVEPKKVIQALTDPSWIEAMQDELLQFKLQKVYKNKKDERGIVIRNKARLVAQGYTQEEGIDYDEVFVPVARIKAIRLFLAYASFKDFVVYQMDVKSAFLYGKIEEEVYVCQPLSFEDPEFPDRVYKVEKETDTARTLHNGEIELTTTIDGKVKIATEASVRRHLQLADSDGISSLPNTKIFEQLSLMGRTNRQEYVVPQPRSPNQSSIVDEAASTGVDVRYGGATTTVTGLEAGHGSGNIDKTPTMPQDSPLLRVNTLGSDEGSMTLQELMVL